MIIDILEEVCLDFSPSCYDQTWDIHYHHQTLLSQLCWELGSAKTLKWKQKSHKRIWKNKIA